MAETHCNGSHTFCYVVIELNREIQQLKYFNNCHQNEKCVVMERCAVMTAHYGVMEFVYYIWIEIEGIVQHVWFIDINLFLHGGERLRAMSYKNIKFGFMRTHGLEQINGVEDIGIDDTPFDLIPK